MATTIPAARNRLFKNVFVDLKTKRKIKAKPVKVIAGKIRGRGSRGSKNLRPIKSKKK
jgi:hypothetical protein